jgi:hypothetical protein
MNYGVRAADIKLRTGPRHFKFKAKLREQKRIEEPEKIGILFHLPSA